jgi:hypothetical protein
MIERLVERRGWGLASCRAVLVLLGYLVLAATALRAQQPSRNDTTRVDTARVQPADSLARLDSLKRPDSTVYDSTARRLPGGTRLLLRDVGAPLGSVVDPELKPGYSLIGKRDMLWERYFTAFDLLAPHLPAVPLTMGAPGLIQGFGYAGSSTASLSALYNGRPLWGTRGRAFDLEFYPLEFVERIEVLRGARAAVFGSGESLIAVNFVEPRYDAEGSYSRIWYSQGVNSTSGADITYARNVWDRANLSLGFRRLVSNGIYPNQVVSNWSGRGAIHWDFSDKLVASITEIYTESTRGLNGGLTDSSSSVPLFGDIVNDSLQEHVLRHDITLAARWYPVGRSRAAGDSAVGHDLDTTFRIDGALYFTYAERGLVVDDRPAQIIGTPEHERAGMAGARVGLTIPLAFARLLGNGFIEYGDNNRVRLEAGGLLELPAGNLFTVRGGAKLHGFGDDLFATLVGEGVIGVGDSISVRGTLRNTSRILPATDCPPIASGVLAAARSFAANGTGLFGEAALLVHAGRLQVDLGAYLRHAPENNCSGFDSYTIAGADATVSVPIGFLTLDNHAVVTLPAGDYRAFPLLYGLSDLHAQFVLLGGNLDLRLGTSLEYQSSGASSRYDDVAGEFVAMRDTGSAAKPPFPLWNAYAQARIGSAFLRVEMRNILGAEFATLARYPTFGRGVYLGVNWALID